MPSCKPALPSVAPLFGGRAVPLIMGVVNVTSDSFFPGSRTPSKETSVARALKMIEEGADILDVGGQSTRPGSEPVSIDEELARVLPVIEEIKSKTDVLLSVDTDKAIVARAAREAGASILNDVLALRSSRMMDEAVKFDAVIVMHMLGESPKTMQQAPRYRDVVREVRDFLEERVAAFAKAGGDAAKVLIDPGIGFGKELEHNLSLLKHLGELAKLAPVVLGASRKSFLGKISPDSGPEDRLPGSLAAAVWAAQRGVRVARVHDVGATRKAFAFWASVSGAS